MNPLLLLLGFLGPMIGLGAMGSGRGAKVQAAAPGKDRTPNEPATDPDPVEDNPVEDDTPSDPVRGGSPGKGDPVVVQPPATAPTPPPQNTIEPDDLPPTTNIFETDGAVLSGRVSTLSHEDGKEIDSIRITTRPEHGNVTVNPDNTLALVLTDSDHTGPLSFGYEVSYADGTKAQFEAPMTVEPGLQAAGWGTGDDIYMLETDANDDIVVEHGDNHRKVYVSGSEDALTIADIAALEDLDPSQITGNWLRDNPDYGSDPDMALAGDAGSALWGTLVGRFADPSSNWLLFERGYEYDFNGTTRGLQGESELHPAHITSYGDGERPVLGGFIKLWQDGNQNIVFSDVAFADGANVLRGENHLYDDVKFFSSGSSFQGVSGLTFRSSEFLDATNDGPNGEDTWSAHSDRSQGLYVAKTDGLLLEGNLFDHNGWANGYDPNASADAGQPPSMYSHNVYLQDTNGDVTFRDNITMRGASYGVQVRSGGYIEDNVILDNNVAVNFKGGDYLGAGPVGEYTLFTDNVVTSAGYKIAPQIGALNWGVRNEANLSSMVDNIVAHMADPNNPSEIAQKPSGGSAVNNSNTPYYDDTIIYNWDGANGNGSPDQNIEGLDTGVLDQTTIQLFTAQLLGKDTATIGDLADYLRAQADGAFDDLVDADLIIRFFQQGFGIAPDLRGEAETLRFVPNDLGDGVRWDNRLNWTTEDVPGTQDGDSVDLAGNWVHYGSRTTTIDDLDYGSGGRLAVTSGRLNVEGQTQIGEWGAALSIDKSGQYWTNDISDDDLLTVDINGGRFANTGDFSAPTDFSVAENGQAILASDHGSFSLGAGSRLELVGDQLRAGFDGDEGGTAILDLDDEATLRFVADADGDIGTIGEFRSGAFGDGPNVLSGADLGRSKLEIDATGLDSQSVELMSVDELIGIFGDVSISGLAAGQGANILVDYNSDTVTLNLVDGAGITLETIGDELSFDLPAQEADALWAALTEGKGEYDDASFVLEEDDDHLMQSAAA